MNFVRILIDALGYLGFEINGIGTDEQRRRGAALHGKGGADVMKRPLPGFQFVDRVVGFDVLRHVVELHVAAGFRHLRVFVVLDVIGAQARVVVQQIDVAIGIVDAANLALLVGFEAGVLVAPARARNYRLRLARRSGLRDALRTQGCG